VSRSHRIYRRLVGLYPRSFRHEYGTDLLQLFDDLVADAGPRAAWSRTALDLVLTLPRYRLETVMNERRSATTITVVIAGLAIAGVATTLLVGLGLYPGVVLLVVAAVLAVGQRSALAQSLRAPSVQRRRRRLLTAAVLGAVTVGSYLLFLAVIGDRWTARDTVIAVVGNAAMLGSIGYLISGLLTPRAPASAGTS
jgi:hypothetical protein